MRGEASALIDGVWLFAGALGVITLSYACSRTLLSLRHGLSVRLQLFFALFGASLLSTALIGFWAIARIEARVAQLFIERGFSTEVVTEFIRDFGPKTSMVFGVLSLVSAGAAWALGRGVAKPIERLALAAEAVSKGANLDVVPAPTGREVRHLTQSLIDMHSTLKDRQRFERFITDMSHDLKNPVAAISASVEVLLNGALEDPDACDRFLLRIDEAAERLNRLLSDFIQLARLEAGALRFDPRMIDLSEVVRSAIRSFEAQAEIQGIQIQLDIQCADLQLSGSRVWLQRAFENLIANAIRYSPKNGRITIRVSKDDTQYCLEVMDDGPGVKPSLQELLFERYVSDYKSDGSGLGLAIVKGVAEAHGGKACLLIDHPNNHQKGAHFVIWINS